MRTTTVLRLLQRRSPAAIGGLVVAVIVYTVKRHPVRTLAHIVPEVEKAVLALPALADPDASAAPFLIACRVRVVAAAERIAPRPVGRTGTYALRTVASVAVLRCHARMDVLPAPAAWFARLIASWTFGAVSVPAPVVHRAQTSRPVCAVASWLRTRLHVDLYSQSGQTLVLMVMALGVLVGMIALVIDGGLAYHEKAKLQAAADAGALAGAQDIPNAVQLATTYVAKNASADTVDVLVEQNAVTVTVHKHINALMYPPGYDITTRAVAQGTKLVQAWVATPVPTPTPTPTATPVGPWVSCDNPLNTVCVDDGESLTFMSTPSSVPIGGWSWLPGAVAAYPVTRVRVDVGTSVDGYQMKVQVGCDGVYLAQHNSPLQAINGAAAQSYVFTLSTPRTCLGEAALRLYYVTQPPIPFTVEYVAMGQP